MALTDDEFIGLAAMIKAPKQFNRARQPAAFAGRFARVRALVLNQCCPTGWFDTTLAQCTAAAAGTAVAAPPRSH